MESLIDSLDGEKWQTVEVSKKGDGFKDFRVMRQHKEEPKGSFRYLIQEEGGDPKAVIIEGCKEGHDPLKDIGTVELKINEEGNLVLGVDLDGDIVMKK